MEGGENSSERDGMEPIDREVGVREDRVDTDEAVAHLFARRAIASAIDSLGSNWDGIRMPFYPQKRQISTEAGLWKKAHPNAPTPFHFAACLAIWQGL